MNKLILIPVCLTLVIFYYIIYKVGKLRGFYAGAVASIKMRQSTMHEYIKDVLPTNRQMQRFVREESGKIPQSKQEYEAEDVKVIVLNGMAYWIRDNKFYASKVEEDGNINPMSAEPIDTTNMSEQELDTMMKIIDELRSNKKNDGSGSGDE
jgi:hypothetical protein